jgi:hypothetical protein
VHAMMRDDPPTNHRSHQTRQHQRCTCSAHTPWNVNSSLIANNKLVHFLVTHTSVTWDPSASPQHRLLLLTCSACLSAKHSLIEPHSAAALPLLVCSSSPSLATMPLSSKKSKLFAYPMSIFCSSIGKSRAVNAVFGDMP